MNLTEMTVDELLERRTAIGTELDSADADLDALEAEVRSINEELERRKAAETKRNDIRNAVAAGEGETTKTFEKEERKTMSNLETRNSTAYINAYANYVKSGDDSECRALLTENVSGVVPVPTFVEGIVAERMNASPIVSRIRKTYARGNVKIGFEISAPAAEAHTEGGDPMTEEELVLGIVTLTPVTLKKWVSISDEALDSMSGEDYLRYIYDEVARGIIKAVEGGVVNAILDSPDTATTTAPAVAFYDNSGTAAIDDFIQARALLSAAAGDLVIIATPAQYAAYKALAIAASYAVDPFDGLEVLFSDEADNPIIGDLSGVLGNFPNGENVQFKYDDRTLMTSDLVRILGRLPVALGVVGNNFFAQIGDGD